MKKLCCILVFILSFGMAGCFDGDITSPVLQRSHNTTIMEVSEQELVERTGIFLPSPEGAENVSRNIINAEEQNVVLAELNFTFNGLSFTERACCTDITKIPVYDENAKADNVYGFDVSLGDITGMDCSWSEIATGNVAGRDAMILTDDYGTGYITWLDVVPGILYNLSLETGATQEDLMNTAELVFFPMQGEC